MSVSKKIVFPLHGGKTWSAEWVPGYAEPKIDISQLTIQHLAHGLSQVNRFCGQTDDPYSVAAHSFILADWAKALHACDQYCRYALLHDCPEALGVADCHGALKKHLCQPIRDFEALLMQHVWRRFEKQDLPDWWVEDLKLLDQRLGNLEAAGFGFPHEPVPTEDVESCPYEINNDIPGSSPAQDRYEFLQTWIKYGGLI